MTGYVKNIVRTVWNELDNTLRQPSRLIKLASMQSILKYLRFQLNVVRAGEDWRTMANYDGLERRVMRSYEDYIKLQGMKLDYINLEAHEERFRCVLKERLTNLDFVNRGLNVLCLGARLGAEVAAFIDLGCFAVGVDLNPEQKNKFVLYGDFHHLQMASDSVDIVYTNSIDHAFDLENMVKEMLRIVKVSGHIIIEPDPGTEEENNIEPDMWQMTSWRTIDDLVRLFEILGLKLIKRLSFEYPRCGEQLVFIPYVKM